MVSRKRREQVVSTASVIAMAIVFAWPVSARAQPPDRPDASNPAPAARGVGGALIPADAIDGAFEEPQIPPPPFSFDATSPPRVVLGPLEVMRESIFGRASRKGWKPLSLWTFFSEGWDEPFARSPDGTNGAPKQNWISTPAGIFGRYGTLDFFDANDLKPVAGLLLPTNFPFVPVHPRTTGNQYAGLTSLLVPLSMRLQLLLGTTYISDNKSSPDGNYVGNWGDTSVQGRFRLIEQRDFTMVAYLGERIPTGKSVNGNDINLISVGAEFWWNFAPQWVLRGGTGINILTGRKSATSVYANQLSIGRYLTTKDARFLKELALYATFSAMSDVSGGDHFLSDAYVLPGMRFGLGKDQKWYALGGIQVPLSGPRPFSWQPQFTLTRYY